MLTPAQKAHFQETGYLIFDPEIPEAVLDAAVSQMEPLYARAGRPNRIQDAWREAPAVKEIATNARVATALTELYGRATLPFQTLNFPKGTQQRAHQDTVHFNSDPSGYMAGVWVALEDMDAENGPLMYYPGTHRWPEYTMQDFGLRPTDRDYGLYEDRIEQLLAEEGRERFLATIRKGEALIWSCSLVHGGSPQLDKGRSRHSQVTHYFFEGCRYYTPMFSTPELKHWRYPVWIR